MKRLSLFLFCSGILWTSASYGQREPNTEYTQQQVDKIVPVSPNAASLGIFGSVPVGHYTGVPNISIPIYEIQSGDVKLPIKLSYHASGIKLAQEASSVGLGWVLNAGGCITREVKHWGDFGPDYPTYTTGDHIGYYEDMESPEPNSYNSVDLSCSVRFDPDYFNPACKNFANLHLGHPIKNCYANIVKYLNNKKDSEPDIFRYNFGNMSGSFFFNRRKMGNDSHLRAEAIISNKDVYLKIIYYIPEKSFEVIDAYGTRYFFGTLDATQEKTTIHTSTMSNYPSSPITREIIRPRSQEPWVLTAWYLDKIITPKQDTITFQYAKEEIYSPINASEDISFTDIQDLSTAEKYYSFSYTKNEQALLKKISFSDGEINFGYSDREDIESTNTSKKACKVNDVTIVNKLGDIIKKVEFNYSYLGTDHYLDNTSEKYLRRRLLLDNIEMIAPESNSVDQKYIFYYNRNSLPPKNSNISDHWGYCNGILPTSPKDFKFTPSLIIGGKLFEGIDRTANEIYSQYGILTSVQYPTGGRTDFEYELNEYLCNDYTNNGVIMNTEYRKEHVTSIGYDINSSNNIFISTDFTVSTGNLLELDFWYESYNNEPTDVFIPFCFEEKTADGTYNEKKHVPLRGSTKHIVYTEKNIGLPSGTYRLKFELDNNNSKNCGIKVDINLLKERMVFSGGGLRIKKIHDLSNNADTISVRSFIYEDSGKSSGILMTMPVYHFRFDLSSNLTLWSSKFSSPGNDSYINIASNTYSPIMSSASGMYVGYSYVEERNITHSVNNGYIAYRFKNAANILPSSKIWVRGFPSISHVDNGLPTNVTCFDKDDNPVKSTDFEYLQVEKNNIKGFVCYAMPLDIKCVSLQFYDVYSERWVLSKKTETHFFPGGKAMTSTTEYGYDSLNWLKNYEKMTAGGDSFETLIKYPTNNPSNDNILSGMVSKNIIGIPIEITRKKNDNTISGEKTTFRAHNGMYLPYIYYQLDTDSGNYYKQSSVDLYDTKGNILQFSNQDNIPTAYLWSYNGRYPIAEIKNTTFSQVKTTFGSSYISDINNLIAPSAYDFYVLDSMRSRIPSAQMTIYRYEPLVGISNITDPSGRKIWYEYDEAGRLGRIKDDKYKIVNEYRYKYNF